MEEQTFTEDLADEMLCNTCHRYFTKDYTDYIKKIVGELSKEELDELEDMMSKFADVLIPFAKPYTVNQMIIILGAALLDTMRSHDNEMGVL